MGFLRKVTSVSTLGMVPYRNQVEKQVKYTKQARNAARVGAVAGIVTARRQGQMMRADQAAAMVPPPPVLPAGWYPDAADTQFVVWWDGMRWFPESRRHQSQLEWR